MKTLKESFIKSKDLDNIKHDMILKVFNKVDLKTGNLVYLDNDNNEPDANLGIVILSSDYKKYEKTIDKILGSIYEDDFEDAEEGIMIFLDRKTQDASWLPIDSYNADMLYIEDSLYNVTHLIIRDADVDKIFKNKESVFKYILDTWKKLNSRL